MMLQELCTDEELGKFVKNPRLIDLLTSEVKDLTVGQLDSLGQAAIFSPISITGKDVLPMIEMRAKHWRGGPPKQHKSTTQL